MKKDKERTLLKVGGNNETCERHIGTLTDHLETENFSLTAFYQEKSKFMTIDVANFCLMTPMDQHAFIRMNVKLFKIKLQKSLNHKNRALWMGAC